MTDKIDIHELAQLPGAGAAKGVLQKHGLWDEYAGMTARKYRMKVSYAINDWGVEVVEVEARCEDEADELACKKVEEMFDKATIEIEDVEEVL